MIEIKPIEELRDCNGKIIIAGPCSAESESQIFETALQLSNIGIKYFRAGIWKPRTRPSTFEGIGESGLMWLKQIKEMTGMKVTTEVAKPEHVEKALNAGVDILWIGARTTASPFAMQEIANSLKGTDTPVLVKNPINPDIELWIGALERLSLAGIKRVAAIHRGFSTYGVTKYRNTPIWEIAAELHSMIPQLPILCDPSHIGGSRELILPISQKAMNGIYSGLFIESHCNPDKALSDNKQQITPVELSEILKNLNINL